VRSASPDPSIAMAPPKADIALRSGPRRAMASAALAAAAAVLAAAAAGTVTVFVGDGGLLGRQVPPARSRVVLHAGLGPMPQPAPMFRSVEYHRPALKKSRRHEEAEKNRFPFRNWRIIGRHPNPTRPKTYELVIPGAVSRLTKREASLKVRLRRNEPVSPEDFDMAIQVFAQRARQEMKWLSVQRREFIRRAKRWADEMLLQDMKPSLMTLRLLLLGCAAVGDERGASWWIGWMRSQGLELGRLEFNAVIEAHGAEGIVEGAKSWMQRMKEEGGLEPDARTFAGIMEAYEVVGNRHMMLSTLSEMQDLEAEGKLAASLHSRDDAAPYVALARSYAKVGDAPRAVAVLKYLQQKGMPDTLEIHKVRLEAHLRTPRGPRRMPEEIERAFRDVVSARPEKGPVYTAKLDQMCRSAMGINTYEAILNQLGAKAEDLCVEMPAEEALNWRKALIQSAVMSKANGMGQIFRKREGRYLAWRKYIENQEVMGQTAVGYRVPGKKGVPDWMSLKQPVIYGGGTGSTMDSSKKKQDRIKVWEIEEEKKQKAREGLKKFKKLPNPLADA